MYGYLPGIDERRLTPERMARSHRRSERDGDAEQRARSIAVLAASVRSRLGSVVAEPGPPAVAHPA